MKLETMTALAAACVVAGFAISACSPAAPAAGDGKPEAAKAEPVPGPGEPTLAEVQAATEKYKDVNVALAEGYIRDPFDLCETADMMGKPKEAGAMGVHYFKPALVGVTEPPNPRVSGNGTHTDFLTPAVLIYEPKADGGLELVAVENLVFKKGMDETGKTDPPSFHGVKYDYMADDPATPLDEGHMFAPHYDRHVWVYRDNPNGVFTPFNPAVSCEHHKGAKTPPMPGMPPAQTTAPAKPN
jgi:hypothetical protein